MPFYRFEDLEQIVTNPHLSTGKGAIIEGRYITLRNNNKEAGTGSQLHYHPNELMIFPLVGKLNSVVGKQRRIVMPGTFVHVPPNARHSFMATEDGPVSYLYVKDNTWTMTGIAEDEAPPDRAPTLEEIAEDFDAGKWPGRKKSPENSQAIIEGLDECFYPIAPSLDEPACSGRFAAWIEGERIAFGYIESPIGHQEKHEECEYEQFLYVLRGKMDAAIGDEKKAIGPGDILHIPRGTSLGFRVVDGPGRYAVFKTLPFLESKIAA